MTFFRTAGLLSALAISAIALPAAAFASEAGTDSRVVVSTLGLDASNPADQARLRHRIAVAAHQVCGQVTQADALTSPGYAECFSQATADAKAQLEDRNALAGGRTTVASNAQ